MIQGDRRLQAMRQGRNPSIRNDRRHNTHVRTQAPDPAATNKFVDIANQGQQSPDRNFQMAEDTQSLLSRVDAMRQQRPAQASAIGQAPAGQPQQSQQVQGAPPLLGQFGQTNSRLERLLAIQRARLGQVSGYGNR